MLSAALKKHWGPKPALTRWTFNQIARAKLTYGAIIWGHAINTQLQRNSLNQINRLAALMCANVKKSTPSPTLELIYHLVPLDLFIEYEAISEYKRNQELYTLDWQGKKIRSKTLIGHRLYWNCLLYTSPSPRDLSTSRMPSSA